VNWMPIIDNPKKTLKISANAYYSHPKQSPKRLALQTSMSYSSSGART